MGDRIEFPDQYDINMKKGLAAVEAGQWEEAEELIGRAYQLRPTAESNYLYFTVLTERGYFEEAVQLAEDMLTYYSGDDALYSLYIEAVIKSGQFLKAESLLLDEIKRSGQEAGERWQRQLDDLNQIRREAALGKEKQDRALERRLYSLAEYTPLEQLDILKEAGSLPQKTSTKAYYSLLVNPFVSQIAKTFCLLALLEEGEKATAHLMWFGEDKEVDLSCLQPFEKHPRVVELHNLLQEKLYKAPQQMEMIHQELNFHLMQLYPFIEEVIQDSCFWLELYIDRYIHSSAENPAESGEERDMLEWFRKLTQNI